MRQLFESASAAERRRVALHFLSTQRRDRPLLLLATSALAHSRLLGELLGPGQACFGWERARLERLALRLAGGELARRGLHPVDALGHQALCTRTLDLLAKRRQLGAFATVSTRPGMPRALSATLRELSLAELEPDALAERAPDLARFFATYRALAEDAGLLDHGQVLRLAREALERAAHPLVAIPVLLLDVPLKHRAEQRLACALLERAPQALATLPHGDRESGEALRSVLTAGAPDSAPSLWDNALERLQAHLFAAHAPRGILGDEVVVMSAPGESRECVEVARRLLWAAEAGTPFDRMAVLLRSPHAYRAHLEEALARASVPAFFATQSVRPDPAGRALLALLACKEEGLSARAFAEYLSLDVVPRPAPEGGPPPAPDATERWEPPDDREVDDDRGADLAMEQAALDATSAQEAAPAGRLRAPHRWERLLVDAAVIGGRERWRRRLCGHRATLELRRTEAAREDPEAAEALARQLEDLTHLERFALPVLEALDALPERATWRHWLSALSELASRVLLRPKRTLGALAELAPLCDLGPVSLTEVRRVLDRRLRDLGERPQQDAEGRVFVGAIEDARGLDFDRVCVMGLAEKMFPERVSEDPLLLDDDRKAIDHALERNERRVDGERLRLRIAVGAARAHVVLSYPRIDLERARPRVPSFYGLEVLRAAEGALPDYASLMRRSDEVAAARIGWPAPSEASAAIDEAEHDLATLSPILGRAPSDTRGSARYLLERNPHLARALRFRARRWSVRAFTPADGLCEASDAARAVLATHRLALRTHAVTALESYAACPYRFALRTLHRLSPRGALSPVEQMNPRERGALMHEVQCRVLSRLRERELLPLRGESRQAAQDELQATMRDAAERYREQLAPAIERVFTDAIEALHGDLKRWLDRLNDSAFSPTHFELGFGVGPRDDSDPESQREPVVLADGTRLAGSIDVVEENGDFLRATDYKSGKADVGKGFIVAGGRRLQPLLYALSLEALRPGRPVVGGRLYYCTTDGGFETRDVELTEEGREVVLNVLKTIDDAIATGFLPAAPAPSACDHCDYRPICGPYEEQRVRHKDATRLAALRRVRELP